MLHAIGTARRARPPRQRQQQEPAASLRHLAAQVAERGRDRRAGRTRRPRGRPFGGQERRRAVFRCRLPHAGRRARPATTTLATEVGMRSDIPRRISSCCWKKPRPRCATRLAAENPQAGAAIEGVVAEVVGGIRNERPQCLAGFCRRASSRRAAEPPPPHRRERKSYQYARERKFEETAIALSILCDTPIDVVERALLDPGAEIVLILAKVARAVADHHQGHPAAARRRPRHVGQGSRPGADELQPAAARHRPARAQLLPHARQRSRGASGGAARSPSTASVATAIRSSRNRRINTRNNPAAPAATRRSDSGSSSRRATNNSRSTAAGLPRR